MGLKRRKYDFSSLRNVLANMRPDKPDVYFSKHVDSGEVPSGIYMDDIDFDKLANSRMQFFCDNPIVDIDGYVHVVRDKVICFKSDMFDLSNDAYVCLLSNIADYLTDCFDDDDMAVIVVDVIGRRSFSFEKITTLSDDVQRKVQVAIDDYKLRRKGIVDDESK